VIDVSTGEVIKNELIDYSTDETHDLRDESVPVPDWFPVDPWD
jgi:hypothetical protein